MDVFGFFIQAVYLGLRFLCFFVPFLVFADLIFQGLVGNVLHAGRAALGKDEKSYLESVANTAADLLGGQIDELKNRQEAEIEVLEAKKRPLEVQLELLEKQKEKEDRILSLQKAQYELKRAEQQSSFR